MKKRMSLIILGVLPLTALAAQEVAATTVVFSSQHFFTALIAGVLMALGFGLVLTRLTAAAGLTAVEATVSKKHDKVARGESGPGTHSAHREETRSKEHDSIHKTARKLSSAYGVWAVVMATVSLFFGVWLAIELIMPTTILFGAITGLAIWGLFYAVMYVVRAGALTSAVGTLMHLAGQGAQSIGDMASSVFSKSEEKQAAENAREVTAAVRDELFGHMDVQKELHRYIKELKPDFGPRDYRKEFEKLLNDTDFRTVASYIGPFDELVGDIQTHGDGMDKEKAKQTAHKLRDRISQMRDVASGDESKADKVADAAMAAAGMSREEVEANRHKVEEYLRNTGKEELNPDGIKRDIERLFHDPKGGAESLRQRLSSVDRSTVTTVIAQRTDMSQEEAQRTVDRVYNVFEQITGTVRGKTEQGRAAGNGLKERALNQVQQYLDSLDRPELSYEGIKHDVELLFHDPKAGAHALANRAQQFDRETIVSMVSSRSDISREQAERIADRIEEARDSVIQRAERMKEEVETRLRQAEEEALHQAEEVSKTASVAAWWVFAAAVVSGIAAAGGGIIAVIT